MCTDEINNGNKIIEKYENDLRSQKNKIKMKNTMALKQEETIKEHQNEVLKYKELLNDSNFSKTPIITHLVKSSTNEKVHEVTNLKGEI